MLLHRKSKAKMGEAMPFAYAYEPMTFHVFYSFAKNYHLGVVNLTSFDILFFFFIDTKFTYVYKEWNDKMYIAFISQQSTLMVHAAYTYTDTQYTVFHMTIADRATLALTAS